MTYYWSHVNHRCYDELRTVQFYKFQLFIFQQHKGKCNKLALDAHSTILVCDILQVAFADADSAAELFQAIAPVGHELLCSYELQYDKWLHA